MATQLHPHRLFGAKNLTGDCTSSGSHELDVVCQDSHHDCISWQARRAAIGRRSTRFYLRQRHRLLRVDRRDSKQGRDVEGRRMVDQGVGDWINLLKLLGPCCLTTCLEWWCIEILILLTGAAHPCQTGGGSACHHAQLQLLALLHAFASHVSSIWVLNELDANQPGTAHRSAYMSLAVSVVSGFTGCFIMVAAKGIWGPLFTQDEAIIRGVKKMMMLMAVVEMVNFPVAVHIKRSGLLVRFFLGMVSCFVLLLVFVVRIDWVEEARNAQILAGGLEETVENK
ncbi:Protein DETOXIFICATION like [Actinidia chinensis var. chinensis]|uniref:Protein DETOXIFICATION like n=1 Tax=Actinidia chinensis var. chinensis TaxID=1590841 RepID=A0A2R6QNI9_ACTCC|nr:Protein DETOXIFICATION like [Actinidia chinensis var. chinensis]